jgi:O-glycosyl hydrolase
MLRLSAVLFLLVQHALLGSAATVTVNVGTTYQTMDGFGFSEAFGYANGIVALTGAAQKQCLDLLFNTTNGAGLTILRNRIGSGGAGDSIEPTSPGSATATPKYTWDGKDSGQVFVSQQAIKYGVKTIYADAWSAPGFMKTNNNQNNGGYLCGVSGETCSTGDWRQAYANFIVQYIKYYQQVGVTISHVGFLNEPEYA